MNDKRLYAGLLIVGLCILGVVFINPFGSIASFVGGDAEEQELGTQACNTQFGEEWSYGGYLMNTPPTVLCNGPNGETGVMEMPTEMQQELDIVVANASENDG